MENAKNQKFKCTIFSYVKQCEPWKILKLLGQIQIWCSLLWKIQCGLASQDSSLPAFGEESTPSFQGDPKSSVSYLRSMVFLVLEEEEKSKRGVQSRAFFCVQESLRSLESCKIPYKYTKKPSLERDLMDEKPFVSCPGSSNIGLSIDFPRGNMSWDKTDKKSQYRTKNAKIWMIY